MSTPALEHLLRSEAPQVLGALVRRFGHFDLAEDAVQEALLAASRKWPADGVPADPRGWLIRVGYRRLVDLLRADQARRRREYEAATAPPAAPGSAVDDSLTLLLLCCHPSLEPTAQVALTLRAVGGLTTAEVAHASGLSENTMSARISRAKKHLRSTSFVKGRVEAVRQVLYLIFNEGYTASRGDRLDRVDLAHEAIRLTRMLHQAERGELETTGLLALMLLTEARRPARTGEDGRLVPLEEQDRERWDQALIREGTELLDAVWAEPDAGPYRIQAAIAAVHAAPGDTDWPQIAALYQGLEAVMPTAPVRLSRVVAVAQAYGPGQGLALLDEQPDLAHEPLTRQREQAVRAHLLERTGAHDEAARLYRAAAGLTANTVERRYLLGRADRLTPKPSGPPG
ncbi:RNA polymerase sigma factor [Paractinoplanes lichenicola]|uniref:Sigma-70 family RNA polymerase sigma factor n=1 Tax=Paractinoplanes lichenicola TaxID=2802976 RepID=A0ABS1VM31_9ACTN|nr:sigma-70 family RNA polymerase sigma factor [Actinoplanes lichenicola]MBL7255270.1 sigma-70 family RNA polymerase sigma factor [Actinoplanes lichenicola]